MNYENYYYLTLAWIAVAIAVFLLLLFVTAPYGRHTSKNWGPMIDNRVGWVIMEVFVLVVLYFFVFTGRYGSIQSKTNLIILAFFTLHYLNRSLIFPFRLRTNGKKMPVVIMLMGMSFNLANGFLIGYFLGNLRIYGDYWLTTPAFIIGAIVFFIGMTINWQSDTILINLRKPGETGYKIPTGGLFKWVSCPNLLGEIIEWTGFAILSWSLPGVTFLIWTFANLVPRGLAHHHWYKEKFEDYPKERKAVFPKVW
ncbi:MAG: DUF1295 domain-containing protein [Crocinitomicaceae bacterium]|nr:DUF1295 domain-containing protein [Crocinitomicaceae bacterium]